MLAAVAAADITPPIGTPLQGHYSPHPESRGILASLEIRTVVFRSGPTTLVLITADLNGMSLDFTQRVRTAISSKHGIEPDHILIAASHTHCGPAVRPSIALEPLPDVLAQIEGAMIASVGDALSKLEPVTLGIGASSAHFNINRRPPPGKTDMAANYAGVIDPRVRILRIDRADFSPLAVLFHYSCHPTTKYGTDGLISPDFPGLARTRIEQQLGCRAAFLPGCCGNIRPNLLGANGKFASATAEQLAAVSNELADAAIRAARYTRTLPADQLAVAEMDVLFPFGSMLPAEEIEKISQRTNQPLRAEWARRHLQMAQQGTKPAGEHSTMQAMRIGPMALIGIPGEPAQEIGYEIERVTAGRLPDIWPTGYVNDKIGYLCTPRMYAEGGYEPTAYQVYNQPAPFKDEQQIIVTSAAKLIDAVSGGSA